MTSGALQLTKTEDNPLRNILESWEEMFSNSSEQELIDEDELIQYFVINQDLNMSPGKIAAQVAHVATKVAVIESHKINPIFWAWYYDTQKKIVLKAKTKKLEELAQRGFCHIRDLGLTEVPKDSLTCVSLGILTRMDAQKYIKKLQLL